MSSNAILQIICLLSVCFLLQCTSAAKPEGLNRQWMMISFKDYQRDFLVKNQASLDLSAYPSDHQTYHAYMGCNQIMVQAWFRADHSVKTGDISTTMRYCDDNESLENRFISEFPAVTRFTLEGHFLTLYDDEGNEMKFVAADWD